MEKAPKKKKRKRIDIAEKMVGAMIVVDELAYVKNKATENANHYKNVPNKIEISIWHDKHYKDRVHFGDSQGPRVGIDLETIEELIKRGFPHLLYYSLVLENFKFLNHINTGKKYRIVLQKKHLDTMINVAVEIHFEDINIYEVTIVTAMCVDDFILFDGQFVLEMENEYYSILKRNIRGKISEVLSCQT